MTTSIKTGFIFSVVSIILVTAASFIPYRDFPFGIFLVAACIGAFAGYKSILQKPTEYDLTASTIVGILAGIGALLGPGAFMLLLIIMLNTQPETFHPLIQLLYAQNNEPISIDQLRTTILTNGPGAALCYGSLNLILTAGCSVLAGWETIRFRTRRLSGKPVLSLTEDEVRGVSITHTARSRQFIRLGGATILLPLICYTLLILFPSYWSGMYRAENVCGKYFDLPFYPYHDVSTECEGGNCRLVKHYDQAFLNVVIPLLMVIWFFVPVFSLVFLAVIMIRRRFFSRFDKLFWSSAIVTTWVLLVLSFPIALPLVDWLLGD